MTIEAFGFGFLVISGKRYSSDLKIYPDGTILESWVRNRGHKLTSDDIGDIIGLQPDAIVSGTGVNGLMVPDEKLKKLLGEQGIQFFAEPNKKAIEIFNHLSVRVKTGACFHLTC